MVARHMSIKKGSLFTRDFIWIGFTWPITLHLLKNYVKTRISCFLPVNHPEKPPVKNHFSLLAQLYSFEIHGSIPQEHIKILAFPIFGVDDVCGHQYILCFYLQAF